MRIRRCGSASEAWRAKASRTSSERRPTEGPQRTSGGDALGSPERPRLSVAGLSQRTTIQRSEGEPDADPTVWFCERSLEGESEQNLE